MTPRQFCRRIDLGGYVYRWSTQWAGQTVVIYGLSVVDDFGNLVDVS